MRLIDADKLRHELIMGRDIVGAKYTDMADTIEAIPIEWIQAWGDHFINDKGFYMGDGYDTIWDMLEAWTGKECDPGMTCQGCIKENVK